MGGFFGTISQSDCVHDLFYVTDYNSHLGTKRGGLHVVLHSQLVSLGRQKRTFSNTDNRPELCPCETGILTGLVIAKT